MNNKQVMLEALEAQLSVKETEVTTYTQEVFNPQVQDLNDSILEWFNQNIRLSLIKAEIGSDSLTMHTQKDRWANRLNFSIRNYWREKDAPEFEFNWSSGNTHSDPNDIEYGITIGRVCENHNTIKDLFINEWTAKYKEFQKKLRALQEPVNSLQSSIYALKSQMIDDQKESYMKPGFSLKLKSYKSIEWVNSSDDSSNDRELQDKPGELKLQTGRSKYDYMFVREFTVNKKVGYKYDLTVVNHNGVATTVQVTTKQFEDFIDSVISWENTKAQDKSDYAIKRFNEIMESLAKEKELDSKRSTSIRLPKLS
jgi:hypothetical protein